MKIYSHIENGVTIELVRKDELERAQAEAANWRTATEAHLRDKDKLRADIAELIERLRERTESHLAASARDVQTIQQQSIELTRWQVLAGQLAEALILFQEPGASIKLGVLRQALAAYESAKSGSLPDPLAEAVKRMEAVPAELLSFIIVSTTGNFEASAEAIRTRLISAAKGEQP